VTDGTTSYSKYACAQQQPEPIWQKITHDPVALATILLVFVTAGLWFSTFKLWRATVRLACDAREGAEAQAEKMERSIKAANRTAATAAEHAEIAQDTAKKELRAYVGFPDISLHGRSGPDPRWVAFVQNFGKTPAREVSIHYTVGIATKGATAPQPPRIHHEFGTLEPGRSQSLISGFPPENLNNNADALASGQKVLTLWGTLTYSDIYDRSYSKDFTAYISHRRINNPDPIIGSSTYVADEIENDAVDGET
jgi:hypothetical protein